MPRTAVDPARLEGEALRRWYLRTPDDIADERRSAEDQRHEDFYGQPQAERNAPSAEIKAQPALETEDDVLWVPNGYGGYRAVRSGKSDFLATLAHQDAPDHLPESSAAGESGEFFEIGSRENRILKQQYIEKEGYWPRTEDGRDYEVSHKRATADGGQHTLDNIEPIHPDEHRPMHAREGDSSRWAKRSSIARAFGGRVEPYKPAPPKRSAAASSTRSHSADARPRITMPTAPASPAPGAVRRPAAADQSAMQPRQGRSTPSANAGTAVTPKPKAPSVRGGRGGGFLAGAGLVPLLSGLMSGRIRTDTPWHTMYDMAGFPAADDYAPEPGKYY